MPAAPFHNLSLLTATDTKLGKLWRDKIIFALAVGMTCRKQQGSPSDRKVSRGIDVQNTAQNIPFPRSLALSSLFLAFFPYAVPLIFLIENSLIFHNGNQLSDSGPRPSQGQGTWCDIGYSRHERLSPASGFMPALGPFLPRN